MKPYYEDDLVKLYHGDCIDVLRELPDASVDSIVTDPPYGLGFMGREWDNLPPGLPWAQECLRVLKPGGHLLAFGGTRTWHRLACAVEDAGFEIRDSIAWMYGSGFPKSLDVSKAIDKGNGENRARQLECTAWMRSTGITAAQINTATSSFMGSHYLTDRKQAAIPTVDMFDLLRPLLPEVPEAIERLIAERTGIEWTDYLNRPVLADRFRAATGRAEQGTGGYSFGEHFSETGAASEDSERWQGWGTALKPAFEPIVVARKPLGGTVAANVLAHGTGALNIAATRVGTDGGTFKASKPEGASNGIYGHGINGTVEIGTLNAGRWPANVILDESHEPVLRLRYNLPTEVERTIRESFGARTDHLPAVQDAGHGAAEQGAAPEVLLPSVPRGVDVGEPERREGAEVGQAAHPGDASANLGDEASQPQDGREVIELEGRALPEPGLRVREVERPADDRATAVRANGDAQRGPVRPGAPASGGSTGGAPAPAVRGRASHQRREVGQPAGEPRAPRLEQLAPDEARRGRRGDVQAATGERGTKGTPLEVLRRECPPGWWHYFEVVGHRREGQAAALDEMSGESKSPTIGSVANTKGGNTIGTFAHEGRAPSPNGHGDSGGASRFFYVAKADASERVRVDGIAHPTVKPLTLMRWLVRLVTPPGGTVLEPFAGSGTTVEACLLEGFQCIAIEREDDYLPLIVQRIQRRRDPVAAVKAAGDDAGLFDLLDGAAS